MGSQPCWVLGVPPGVAQPPLGTLLAVPTIQRLLPASETREFSAQTLPELTHGATGSRAGSDLGMGEGSMEKLLRQHPAIPWSGAGKS